MFGGRYRGTRWYIDVEHRKGGPHAGELSDAPSCKQCNTSSRARADAAAAALHVHDATYTRRDSATLAKAHLALMGRGEGLFRAHPTLMRTGDTIRKRPGSAKGWATAVLPQVMRVEPGGRQPARAGVQPRAAGREAVAQLLATFEELTALLFEQ